VLVGECGVERGCVLIALGRRQIVRAPTLL
jgi:hypothetical protein